MMLRHINKHIKNEEPHKILRSKLERVFCEIIMRNMAFSTEEKHFYLEEVSYSTPRRTS